MPLTDDEIRALGDEALNKLLAEMIGLPREGPVGHLRDSEFSGQFGPVAWLERWLPVDDEVDMYDGGEVLPGDREWAGVWSWLNLNLVQVVRRGPRALAEDCAIAGQQVEEKEC